MSTKPKLDPTELSASQTPTTSVPFKASATDNQSNESDKHFPTVADAAPVLIWMCGADHLRTFFNQSCLAFTGRTTEEELGNGWVSGIHPEDLNRCLEIYSAEFDARSSFTLEYRLRRHDGEYRWIFDSGVPRFGSGESFLGYIGSCIDVTDRKLAELALAEQLKFETLLTELSATFINLPAVQLDSQIIEAQKRICETLGLDRSSMAQFSSAGD